MANINEPRHPQTGAMRRLSGALIQSSDLSQKGIVHMCTEPRHGVPLPVIVSVELCPLRPGQHFTTDVAVCRRGRGNGALAVAPAAGRTTPYAFWRLPARSDTMCCVVEGMSFRPHIECSLMNATGGLI